MEWSEANTFNPMNSVAKGLTYWEHYKGILGWMEEENPLPPPIEASLDPTAACNNSCYYCSSNRYVGRHNVKHWGVDYMTALLSGLVGWGVQAYCWGGREATLTPGLAGATRLANGLGLEGAIVTNGVYLPDDLLEALLLCKWIGVSVDTTEPEVYKQVRGTDDCEKVWANIGRLGRKKNGTALGVRALILPETVDTLYDVCYQARESGATFCHIRPADLEREDLSIEKPTYDVDKVNGILERCHELATPSFGVFTIRHKFNSDLRVTHNFKRCLASPLVVQICADKKKYLCVDHRMDPRYEVKEWGSDQHRELIKSIVPDRDCSRCTWGAYQTLIETVVVGDKLHRNFP